MNVLHSETESVCFKKKLLHPKLNSEQSLHEVIAGMGACSLSSRTSDCCLDGSQQTRLSEMFFCWILKSSMVIAIDCLRKKHLLPSLCTEACPVWPFLQEWFLLTVYECLLNAKSGHFCIRSNLRWHLQWADPPARFSFQQFETVPRASPSRSCLQESSGQSWIWNQRPPGPISQILCYEGGSGFSQLLCCLQSVLCRCLSGDFLDDPGNKYAQCSSTAIAWYPATAQ